MRRFLPEGLPPLASHGRPVSPGPVPPDSARRTVRARCDEVVCVHTVRPDSDRRQRGRARTRRTATIADGRSPPGMLSHPVCITSIILTDMSSPKFHWQDLNDKNYLKALHTLNGLRAAGSISALGLCNFDSVRTDEICTVLGPGSIATNQVQVRLSSLTSFFVESWLWSEPELYLSRHAVFHPGHSASAWDEPRLREARPEASDVWHVGTHAHLGILVAPLTGRLLPWGPMVQLYSVEGSCPISG